MPATQSRSSEDKIALRKTELKNELARIVSVLINEYEPLKIILFGSLVTGNIHEYSDIDLVVIKNFQKDFYSRLEEVGLLVMPELAAEILVYTPEEFEIVKNRLFFREEVLKRGKVLYDVSCDYIRVGEIVFGNEMR